MIQFRGGINWNTVSGGDSMSPFRATDVRTWASGSPKRVVSVRGGNVRRASRRRAARARGVAPRRGASIAPSWPGAPCVLGAAELAAHPWSRPSSMPAKHAGYSRRTRRGGAARAMARHAGYRIDARSRATELGLRVAGLRRHPSALRWPPAHGVAPPAARGRVFVRRRTLCAASLCVTRDRASARTLWWVEWHQRRVCLERRANLARI